MKVLRFYSFFTLLSLLILQVACASSGINYGKTASAETEHDVSAELNHADQLFAKRDGSISNLRETVAILKNLRNPGNRNYEIEWKYAQSNYFLAKRTDQNDESDSALRSGVEAGLIASRMEPGRPEGHFWYGANLGQQAKKSPVTVGLTQMDTIRSTMQKVIDIQPDYQHGSAYDALAQIELAGGMFGGNPEKAVEYLETAIQMNVENIYLHLHLGQAYLAVNRDAEARKQLEQVLIMKAKTGLQFEYEECARDAKKLLQTRF